MTERAVCRHPPTDQQLCRDCGQYIAGRDEGEVGAASELLVDAVIALRGLGVSDRDIRDLVCAELAGRGLRIGPARDHPGDPRCWARRLEPIDA